MKNVDGSAVRLVDEIDAALAVMPDEFAVTLTDIAAACREGLMAVAVEAGLATAMAIVADEAAGLCGEWNARDPERSHVRGGTTGTSVVMGGQRLPARRPRVRATDGTGEVGLESFGVFSRGDILNATIMERMLAGVATRSLERVADPLDVEVDGLTPVRIGHEEGPRCPLGPGPLRVGCDGVDGRRFGVRRPYVCRCACGHQ